MSFTFFPLERDFLGNCARCIVAACHAHPTVHFPDLSACRVVVPNPALAPPLRAALVEVSGRALLLPRILTWDQLAGSVTSSSPQTAAQPHSQRTLALYQQLKSRGWFDDGARWEICAELIALFDELSQQMLTLPASFDEFAAQLETAYRLRGSAPLRFEARLVHELWRAEAAGPPSATVARALSLAKVTRQAAHPLFVICDAEPEPYQRVFFDAYIQHAPLEIFVPQRDAAAQHSSLLQVLNAAWPPRQPEQDDALPLRERALAIRARHETSPLQDRVRFYATNSLEEEAGVVAAQVRRWLAAGRQRIALIAADRVAARRARALLERDGILAEDETGWKLSTSRAGALLDAWLEVVAEDAYHRDLLDLLKSPFVFAEVDAAERHGAVLHIEQTIVSENLITGLHLYETALARNGAQPIQPIPSIALELIRRIRRARQACPKTPATLKVWLSRLEEALSLLGALPPLRADAAGASVLELIAARREELAEADLTLGFPEWRDWLNRELETQMFRDRSISSPVLMTHLTAARLRTFDAAIIIGADGEHLAPEAKCAILGNIAVRAELGLPSPLTAAQCFEDDLAALFISCGELVLTWQQWRDGEVNLLNPALARLSLLHQAAWNSDLRETLPLLHTAATVISQGTARPAPSAAQLLPDTISASAYASLVACPYQFYARHLLGLSEREAVQEEMEKRDYGELVHRILKQFHSHFPLVAGQDDAQLEAVLNDISRDVFAQAVERNFIEHAWRLRWHEQIAGYIAWQREREAAGWRYLEGEVTCNKNLPLSADATLRLRGRIDRIDESERNDGGHAVLDYKTQKRKHLQGKVADVDRDVQLAFYTMLHGATVSAAVYVALDDTEVSAVDLPEPQVQAQAQSARLARIWNGLRGGAALPANGTDEVCAWCEMYGLCRKSYWNGDEDSGLEPGGENE